MHPRRKGTPPAIQRKGRSRQNPNSQMRQIQIQHQYQQEQKLSLYPAEDGQSHDPYKYSFEDLPQSSGNPIWDPVESRPMNTMNSSDVHRMQGISAPMDLFWRSKSMPVASTVVANSTAQPSIQSQNLPKHVSEQMQHIHPLANRFTSVEVQGISEPTHIKQELQEIERQQLSCNRYLQTSSRPTNMGDPVQTHFSHNNEASHRRFSQTEHQHFLNLQHHLSPADGYNQRSPPEPQKFQLNGAVSHPVSSHIQQSNTNMWKIPGRGAPPQAFPEPSRPGINAPTSLQQTIQFHVNKPRGNVPSEENLGTKNKYVQKASEVADEAKLAHRALLKDAQRNKEMDAEARGEPLSAKDKERERSRRESAVTRKRAEIYIQELERTARNVPELESTIQHLYSECQRLGQLCGMRSPDGNHSLPKAPLLSAISVFPSPEGAKSEPGMVESPNTSSATRVVSELKELDL